MNLSTFLFMLLLLFIYSIIGGCILRNLEIYNELDTINQTNRTITNVIGDGSCVNVTQVLQFQSVVKDMTENGLYLKDNSIYFRERFDIRSAILVMCTIHSGFGIKYSVPQTTWGQIFTNVYALLTSYYQFFLMYSCGQLFDVLLQIVFKKLKKRSSETTVTMLIHLRQFILTVFGVIFLVLIPAAIVDQIENWPYDETLYFCITYMITLGFIDFIPGHDYNINRSEDFIKWYRLAVGFWLLLAVLWFAIIIYQFCGIFGWFIWEHFEEIAGEKVERVKYLFDNNTYRRMLEEQNRSFREKFNKATKMQKEIEKIDEIDRQRKQQLQQQHFHNINIIDNNNINTDNNFSQQSLNLQQIPNETFPTFSKRMILFDPTLEQSAQVSHGDVSVIKF